MADTKPRLKQKYDDDIRAQLMKELKLDNVMSAPTITKIVVNSGLGEAKVDSRAIEEMVRDIALITGQRPVVTKAKKAISNFKIREGMDIGAKVTLRRDMMWYFLDRLIAISLPRIKDFRGVPRKSFDKQGNYTLGISEHTVFPEVDPTQVSKLRGMQITICTSAPTDEQAFKLLELLGMPFKKVNKQTE